MAVSRYKKIGIVSIFMTTSILILYETKLTKLKNILQYNEEILDITKNTKIILFWDTFHGQESMNLKLGNVFKHCKINNCITTRDRELVPQEKFDAIIFHGARWNSWDDGLPYERRIEQKYIFFSWESPYNTNFDNYYNDDFYNWTMTYRRDSDIYFPYAIIVERKTNYIIPNKEDIVQRPKLVAWMVSNCDSPGTMRRRQYVEELRKYIHVDIYGYCGDHYCEENCYEMFEKNYKFYLSFENSMCVDYATEKMYNVLNYNIIPIVLGFGDYQQLAPPHSVIDTHDFETTKDLALYILMLSENVGRYLKYFEWKKNFVIQDSRNYALCQLCDKLNRPLKYSTYSDVRAWYFGYNKCYE